MHDSRDSLSPPSVARPRVVLLLVLAIAAGMAAAGSIALGLGVWLALAAGVFAALAGGAALWLNGRARQPSAIECAVLATGDILLLGPQGGEPRRPDHFGVVRVPYAWHGKVVGVFDRASERLVYRVHMLLDPAQMVQLAVLQRVA